MPDLDSQETGTSTGKTELTEVECLLEILIVLFANHRVGLISRASRGKRKAGPRGSLRRNDGTAAPGRASATSDESRHHNSGRTPVVRLKVVTSHNQSTSKPRTAPFAGRLSARARSLLFLNSSHCPLHLTTDNRTVASDSPPFAEPTLSIRK